MIPPSPSHLTKKPRRFLHSMKSRCRQPTITTTTAAAAPISCHMTPSRALYSTKNNHKSGHVQQVPSSQQKASSFSIVAMKAVGKPSSQGKRDAGGAKRQNDNNDASLPPKRPHSMLSDAQEARNRKPTSQYVQQKYASGLIKPRLPQDLSDEMTFDEFMNKMMRENDFEAMYKKLYGSDASTDEEYKRFKDVMLADPLTDELSDYRKDESVDIVELTREQYLDYRSKRVELKYAYGKHGYEKIKIYHQPNRKGFYELHLFKAQKPLDKNEIFQMNRIKYQLRNVIGLSPEHTDELKRMKKEHDDKKMKRIQDEMEEKLLKKKKHEEIKEKVEEQKKIPLIDRFRKSLGALAEAEMGKKRRKKKVDIEGESLRSQRTTAADEGASSTAEMEGVARPPLDEPQNTSSQISESVADETPESEKDPNSALQTESQQQTTEVLESDDAHTTAANDDLPFTKEHYETFFGVKSTHQEEAEDVLPPSEYDEELDTIRSILSDDIKMKQLSEDLNVPAALLREIYFQGGAEDMEDMQHSGEFDEGPDLTEKEMEVLAKELVNKTKFDLELTNRVVADAVGQDKNVKLVQRNSKTKPVLNYIYDNELDKFRDMTPEERFIEMREEFAKYTIGMVSLPYHVYRAVKTLLRDVPRDELFRAAKIVSTVMRIRTGGFGRKYEAATFNSRVDVDDLANEQKHILRRMKDYTATLNLNDKGEFSQLELAEANLAEKQNLKFAYNKNESAAYIGLKLPGFYAVNKRVMNEISKRMPDWKPKSQLDFGAGPGTSILAANDVWTKSLNDIIAIEPSSANMEHALELTKDVQAPIAWRRFLTEHFRRKYDLVTVSYVLNEITDKETRMQTLETLWNATGGMLVIIDSGTPLGFSLVREARDFILSKKDAEEDDQPTVLAPCPHDSVCPMAGTRWCHFHQRTERTDFLKQLKNRALLKKGTKLARSYEDEDYSYVVIRRKGVTGLDPIEKVREKENRRLKRLDENGKLDKKKERLRMEMLLYKRKLARESHSWPRLIAGSKFSTRKVSSNFCTPQGTLVMSEVYPKTMGRKNGYRLARTSHRGDLFSFPRRIVDPEKPSSRDLYLSKVQNRVRANRMDTREMHRLIDEFGLIPKVEERVQKARERWAKIKKHWKEPKEKSSFMAKDLVHNRSRSGDNQQKGSSQNTPHVESRNDAGTSQEKRQSEDDFKAMFQEQRKLDAKTPIMSPRKTAVRASRLFKSPRKVTKHHKKDRL